MVVETKTAKKPETEALHFTSKFILSVYQSAIMCVKLARKAATKNHANWGLPF